MRKYFPPNSPEWHKHRSRGYLVAVVLLTLKFLASMFYASPLLIKAFVPYPALESVERWKGTVHVEGEFGYGAKGRVVLPRYFIDTPQGRKEFHCGMLAVRYECDSQFNLDEADGEVWYHPLFGTLQRRFVLKRGRSAGEVFDFHYRIGVEIHQERNYFDRYFGTLVLSALLLGGAVFCWLRYRKHRAAFLA